MILKRNVRLKTGEKFMIRMQVKKRQRLRKHSEFSFLNIFPIVIRFCHLPYFKENNLRNFLLSIKQITTFYQIHSIQLQDLSFFKSKIWKFRSCIFLPLSDILLCELILGESSSQVERKAQSIDDKSHSTFKQKST